MPSIYLGKQSGMYYTDRSFIVVDEQPYSGSNMFRKFQHKPTTYFTPGFIYLFKGNVLYINFWENRAILQPDSDYYDAALKEVDVYYNRFDSSNTPLVCVLKFNNPRNNRKFQDRIYRLSRDGYLIDENRYAVLSILPSFTGDPEKELLEILLKESDTHLKTITYELDRTNPSNSEIEYASQNILLSPIKPVKGYNSNEFYKYTHKYRYNRPKKSLLLYNNNAPMFDNNNFVQNIQTEEYDTVNVYYSNELNTPLLIEFMNRGRKSHIQRLNQDDSKWTRNDIHYSNEETLINHLRGISRRVKEKKEEEQQRRDRDRERRKKTPERKRTPTPKRLGEQESISTQRTEDQESLPTQREPEIKDRTISSREELQGDEASALPHGPKPSLTGQMCVLINKQTEYKSTEIKEICKNERSPKNETQPIDVQPENISVGSSDLHGTDYKFYTHDITPNPKNLRKNVDQDNQIELNICISNLKIPLFDSTGLKQDNLIYKPNIFGDELKVYFYHNTKPQKTDTVPLMIQYNEDFYGPSKRDNYFTGWERIDSITSTSDKQGIKNKLDSINKELNRIELSNTGGTNCEYGLPKVSGVTIKDFVTDRVKVTVHKKENYTRVVHRTINSFTIGSIMYGNDDISKGSIKIKGTTGGGALSTAITIDKRNNHTKFVTDINPNTVVCYYSKKDTGHKLPQLIVLLQTEGPIPDGEGADTHISSKRDSKYGYYVLATNNGGGYKYEWREPEDTGSQLELNDETEFSLLNAIIIMVDKQDQYQENEISGAVKSSGITSPGNSSDVNRLKEKTINATDYTGTGCTYAQKYGYKLYAHDISGLVTWTLRNGQLSPIPLIGGLRFLISSSDNANSYKEIKLFQDAETKEPNERVYYKRPNNKVYVWFYGSDPRPLLLCYGGNAYKPKKPTDPIPEMQVIMDYTKWTRVTSISQCTCMGNISTNDDHILDALLEVVCFLNPVQINPKQIPGSAKTQITKEPPKVPLPTSVEYNLHEYKYNSHVKMKITRTSVSCYEQYKYEPDGTGGSGQGFRLGSVHYCDSNFSSKFNKLDYNTTSKYRHHPLVKATVYYYDNDKEYKDPLLIELIFEVNWSVETSKEKDYWKLTNRETNHVAWNKDSAAKEKLSDDSDNKKLVEYLDTIRYNFKNVLQVCIAIKKNESYPANLFDWNSGNPVEPKEEIQVTVTEETNCGSLTETGFRCFKHKITELGSTTLHKIGGLEFFTPNESGRLVPMNLYELPTSRPIKPLYYNCGMGDIYVYFYGKGNGSNVDGDPRPLLLCYNNKGYKAFNMTTYDSQIWLKSTEMNDCLNITGDNILLKELVKVCNFLNPVYINKAVTGVYRVHTFNGQHIYNSLKETKSSGNFCYHKYVHSPNGFENKVKNSEGGKGFRLGKIEYGSNCIREEGSLSVCITSLLDEPAKTYTPASEVVVYYYRGDKMYKNPLLVALCKRGTNGLGVAQNGNLTSTCTYQPYYELQRATGTTKKIYKKGANSIDLNDRKGGDLEKLLDKILYYVSNSILIDLSFRTRTEVKYPGEIGKQNIIIEHNIYSARVYDNFEDKPKPEKTDKTIEVNVCGPTDVLIDKKQKTGYMCYCHKITTISDDEQIRGLRLFLWDNRKGDVPENDNECKGDQAKFRTKRECCEISLVKPTWVELEYIIPITYTVCKGDLYVYFYGSDPRPLLLCYNGQAYKPSDLETYNQKWCHVKEIESCQCDQEKFDPSSVLKTLYQISMFLNPVKLSETIEAYTKVIKPVMGDRRKEAKEKGEPVGKWPEHDYTVQTFGDTEIRVRVRARDLQCYRVYTHSPADSDGSTVISRGFRLGNILYGEKNTRGATETCLQYPQELPLQSVSLYYYMYDQPHHYPLIVQLDYGFGGPLDDYYRVCKTGGGSVAAQAPGPAPSNGATNGAQSTQDPKELTQKIAKTITWVKMPCSDKGEGKQHEHSSPDPPTPSGSGTTSNGNCKGDCPSPTRPDGTPLDEEIKKELQLKDGEFVKRAHEIQQEMRDKTLIQVHPMVYYLYRDLAAELQWQIERHCYDVRKRFNIEYKKGDNNKNLILATDENCHEDSIIGYVLGGGAVGVAGGGGWKFAVVVLSMFIKV